MKLCVKLHVWLSRLARYGLGIGLAGSLSGCLPVPVELSEPGANVQLLANPEEHPQCVFLGEMRVVSLVSSENSYTQALTKLRNRVGFQKGTHINIHHAKTDELSTTLQADAYRCPLTEEGRIREAPGTLRARVVP